MQSQHEIFAPVILGTSRQGRASEHAAHFVVDHVAKRSDMRTDLIDIRQIRLSIDDAGEAPRTLNSPPPSTKLMR